MGSQGEPQLDDGRQSPGITYSSDDSGSRGKVKATKTTSNFRVGDRVRMLRQARQGEASLNVIYQVESVTRMGNKYMYALSDAVTGVTAMEGEKFEEKYLERAGS